MIVTTEMIKYFKSVLISEHVSDQVYENINKESLKVGVYFCKSACGEDNKDIIESYINDININPNSTFYKTWEDVTSKSRFEIFCDQIAHYYSVFISNYTDKAYIYTPNDFPKEFESVAWNDYIYIKSRTAEEYYSDIIGVLMTGVALNSALVKDIVAFAVDYINHKNMKLTFSDLSCIKNREAKMLMMSSLGIKPDTSGLDLFNYIYTKLTQSAMVIKNKQTINTIKRNMSIYGNGNNLITSLTDNDMKLLSEVFYRYKPLFLAMKNDYTKSIINKIRKYANRYHKPMVPDFWANIINDCPNISDVRKKLPKLNTFRLVNILNEMERRFAGISYNIYRIRNGKSFLRKVNKERSNRHFALYVVLYEELVERLKTKACKIAMPENIELTCPVSEKNFIGDIPMGSYVKLEDENNYIGIYWRNEWGTRDYDLSAITDFGDKIGWNANFNNNGLIYSGDIIDADPEATEILYSKNPVDNFIICVNRFNGTPGTKFNIFFGSEEIQDLTKNYMVDPSTIKFRADMKPELNNSIIGRVHGDRFYFSNMTLGNSIVSVDIKGANLALTDKLSRMLNLRDVLDDAGFEFVEEDADIDLRTLDKSKIIKLFS